MNEYCVIWGILYAIECSVMSWDVMAHVFQSWRPRGRSLRPRGRSGRRMKRCPTWCSSGRRRCYQTGRVGEWCGMLAVCVWWCVMELLWRGYQVLFPPPFPFPFAPSPPLSSLSLPLLQTQEEGGKEHLGAGSSSKCEGAGLEQSHWECTQPLQKYVPLDTASQHFSACHLVHMSSLPFSLQRRTRRVWQSVRCNWKTRT